MITDFVHLHNHSEYSLLDGACRVKELVGRAAELGMSAVAITDHGVLYGVIDFYREAKKQGIKPIIGCEVYVAKRSRLDKEAHLDDNQYHLILLCKNEVGYKNLLELVSRAFIEGFYYKPRVDLELLERYHEGLIALSACIAGEIPQLIIAGKMDAAKQLACEYERIFGQGNFYLELQDHGMEAEKIVCQGLHQISLETGIPLVATNDLHYLRQEDAAIHDVLLCIQTGKTVSDEDRMRFPGNHFYMKSGAEMRELFAAYPQAADNTVKIAAECNLDFSFGEFHLPYFAIPEGYDPESYLDFLTRQRFKQKYPSPAADVQARLDYELDIIKQMGFAEYFLIVQDLVNWARSNGVPVGPGRGSAAGSLVSYVLGITSIDPLKYDLLFERFLNPERVSMPDIDIDFCFEKRDRVINYIIERYGADRVAQIITFGTMAARAAIRDVGRALDVPYAEVDKIAKLVPAELGVTLDRALEMSPDLMQIYQNNYETRKIIDLAKAIEGMPRHASIHAAGVVIGRESLSSIVPLQKTTDGHIITQFAKETVEDIGLLKMDILGLRTLTVIDRALDIIKKTRQIELDIDAIPLDDPSVYELLQNKNTIGVFQLESDGLRRILSEMQPSRFEDLIAIIALYRPGPLGSGMVDDFINCKHGRQKIEYIDPRLEDILQETYGVVLYQEQVMRVASDLANFTMGEADELRRAMGKKKVQELMAQREKFVAGAAQNQISEDVATRLFDIMESFAGYGFNKSHSAAYAMITYQTAYLKTHFPQEYMCAFLSSVIDHQDRIVFYIKECRNMGIEILPPDINESFENFTVGSEGIRFGLGAIKNVGVNAVKTIVKARKSGVYKSLFDFCQRVDLSQINKRVMENLIAAGCFDSLGISRKQALSIMDECMDLAVQIKQNENSSQLSLFGNTAALVEEPRIRVKGEMDNREKMSREKEVLGFYVSQNPLDQYRDIIPLVTTGELAELGTDNYEDYVRVAGLSSNVNKRISKKGDPYASFQLEDLSGQIDMLLFSSAYRANIDKIESEQAILVEGFLDRRDEQPKISVRRTAPLPLKLKELNIRLPYEKTDADSRRKLIKILQSYPGDMDVILHLPVKKVVVMAEKYNVAASIDLKKELNALYGKANVWFG
ncbi:DNA polymerase III, alpha subunit [Syntrophomonas zehnderi OL-4]|uniref:DNA polymerase III subunit alpha n=1 Tax=Syntrophomonas zehnderi OL-4 TaxID=690567 RepID=A0A0E4GDL8_9FIRM|nr:DNA polymerase III subunit alpha [Syntrophomonas zehnderi]CFY12039.1 DNA polymerase III, alpha subunit [Syntrophomonas zehnderi OL-4]